MQSLFFPCIKERDKRGSARRVLEEQLIKPRTSFVLIYCASRDGWEASRFHANCDNKGPTVTVVKSRNNNIFGGYTEQSWDGEFFTTLHSEL